MCQAIWCGSEAGTGGQTSGGKVRVHTWTAATSRLANAIWLMAVSQHQFHLDYKHNKVGQLCAARSHYGTVNRENDYILDEIGT